MPATLRKIVAASLARNRRRLRKKLADAEALKKATSGVKWEAADAAKRELQTCEVLIEEWRIRNGKNN